MVGAGYGRFTVMVVPLLSPSGSVLAVGAYVEESAVTLVTLNTVDLVNTVKEKFPSEQVPVAAVVQVNVPLWLENVPLTVAPGRAIPFESKTVAVTCGCHVHQDEPDLVDLSRSPT